MIRYVSRSTKVLVVVLTLCVLAFGQTPSITSLSPTSGSVGATVTISGTNFGATQGSSTVTFSGATAAPTSWSNTSIVASVPIGALTGNVVVKVNGYASNGVLFTVPASQSGFGYEGTITIKHGQVPNTDQVNFPVLLAGTYPYLANVANGGAVQSPQGYDIIFTSDAAGTNVLPFEKESYSSSTGAILYWVNVPTVSHTTDTAIYMFYGNSSVTTDQSNKGGVWDANYKGVWHLPNGTTLNASDSTTNGNNGTINGSISATAGQVDGAASSSGGTNNGISTTNSITADSSPFTYSFWAKYSRNGGATVVRGKDGYGNGWSAEVQVGSTTYFYIVNNSPTMITLASKSTIPANTWKHFAAVWVPGSGMKLYVNGALDNSNTNSSGTLRSSTKGLQLLIDTLNNSFNGVLDEVEISSSARSGDWIATEYNNQSSPTTFYSVATGVPIITNVSPLTGWVGESVTINGLNFGPTQGTNTLTFNGVTASPTNWSATSIVVPVPSGASTGNIVLTVNGQPSNAVSFTVIPIPPSISAVSPSSGPVGTSFVISGTRFGASQGNSTVTFNGVSAAVSSWSNTSIVGRVPVGATSGNVVVNVNSEPSNGVVFNVGPSSSIYSYERAIVINSAQVENTNQQNFPLLISGTYADLANVASGGLVQSLQGYDIIFTSDAAGNNLLPFEQESYSSATGAVNYWVGIPTVSHSANTVIYMFYGGQSIVSDQSNKTAVWDTNYVGVWHFPDGTNLSANDSTSDGYNGVISGVSAVTGEIGGGAEFGGYEAITVSPAVTLSGSFTVEGWAKPSLLANSLGLTGSRVSVPNADYAFDVKLEVDGIHGDIGNGGQWLTTSADASFPYTANTWHHFVYTVVPTGYQIYEDGQQIGLGTFSGTPLLFDSTHPLQIGETGVPDEYFYGALDEIRVSKTARSPDWIATEYNNQSSPQTFAILCPGQAAGTTPPACNTPPPTLNFPQVVQVEPSSGNQNVPLNARIVVRFAHPAKPDSIVNGTLSVTVGTTSVAGTLALSADGLSLTFTPSQNLTASTTYSVAVTDISENQTSPEFQSTFTTGSSQDTTVPQVTATNPQNASTGVPTNVPVVVQFSKPINPATITPQTFHLNATGGTLYGSLQVDPSGLTASFVPEPPLPVNYTISVSLSAGIMDTSGNSLSAQTFSFTTSFTQDTDAPASIGINPANGATGVPTNSLVTLEFSEPLDVMSVQQGFQLQSQGTAIAGGIALSDGNKRITFTPQSTLSPNTVYAVTTASTILDVAGFPLQNPGTFTFTTGPTSDTTTPQATTFNPLNNATNVPINPVVQVQFSKPIDPLTVNASSLFLITSTGSPSLPGIISVSGDGLTATFTPSIQLEAGVYYVARATNGITDVEGHAITTAQTLFLTGVSAQTNAATLLSISPPNASTGTPVNSQVDAQFSSPLLPGSVNSSSVEVTINGVPIAGTVSLSTDHTTITFVPSGSLNVSTVYTIVLNGIMDVAGNQVTNSSTTFTTGSSSTPDTTKPSVVSVSPTNGKSGVATNSSIVLTFSEPIDPTSVSNSTVQFSVSGFSGVVAGSYTLDSTGTVLTFTPLSPLPGGATISVAASYPHPVLDFAGNQATQFFSSFSTASGSDTTAPSVIAMTPQNGATNIGLNAQIALTFSKSLNPSTIATSNFSAIVNGVRLGISLSNSADNRVVTMTLPVSYPALSVVNVVVTSGVTDLSGNALVPFEGSFTTTSSVDTTHPYVFSQRPGYAATNVPANSTVVLYFNEPMNGSTVQGAVHVVQNGNIVNGTTQVSENGQVVQFTPAAAFLPNTQVQIFVDSTAQDLDGNSATAYQGVFKTAADPIVTAPTLTGMNPSPSTSSMPTNIVMGAAFSEPLDPTTLGPSAVSCTLNQMWFETAVNLLYGNVLQITPRYPLPAASSPICEIGTGVRGINGLAIPGPYQLTFTTGSGPDTTAPAILAYSPRNGSTNVGDNALVRVVFNKPINPLTVNGTTIQLSGGGNTFVPDSIAFSNSNQTVLLTPHAPLPDNTQMSLTINGVTDVAGNLVPAQTTQFTTGQGPDTIQPSLVSVSPIPGATSVALNTVVELHFSEPIDPGSVNTGSFAILTNGSNVAGSYSVSPDGQTIDFLPSSPLVASQSYTVQVGSILDLSGNMLASCSLCYFSFTTGLSASASAPQVVAVNPPNNSNSVPTDAQIVIQFNEPIDGTVLNGVSLSAGGTPVSFSSTLTSANQILTLAPALELSPATVYTLNVSGVRDFSGNVQVGSTTSTFTTSSGADLSIPAVSRVTPAYNASNVATNSTVQVQFSKPVDPLTVNSTTITLAAYPGGGATSLPLTGSVSLSADGLTATFTPNQPLDSATYYLFRATNGILDVTGQPLTTFQSPFTTAQTTDTLPPVVLSPTPTSGAIGANISVYGSYFGSTQGSSTVTINGLAATIQTWADAQIGITVPSGATSGPLVVTANGVASNAYNFTIPATPTITNISPSSGVAGTTLTITGTNFGDQYDTTTVFFYGISVNPVSWTPTSLTVIIPSSITPGNVPVSVSLDGTRSSNSSFTLIPTPSVTSLTPASGVSGTSVQISGANFGSTQDSSMVYFNGAAAASITVWSPGSITAIAPSNVTSGPITVVVSSVTSNTSRVFTVVGPAIGSLSPPAAAVGAQVNVNGSGFVTSGLTTQVLFNGLAANIYSFNTSTSTWLASNGYPPLSWNITSLTVTVPTGVTSGPVTVVLGSNSSNGVQFTAESQPTVTGISPASGEVGNQVTITGTGFGATQSSSQVLFYENIPAQIVSWSDTSIQATVPAGVSTGAISVQVGTLSGQGPSFTATQSSQLTDSLGNQSTYLTTTAGGEWVLANSQGSGCSSCTIRGNTQETQDANGNVLTHTDDLGRVTTYTYDANNNVASVSQQLAPNTPVTTSYTYNSFGEVLTMTDPLGNVTTNAYDANGNLTSVTTPAPDGHTPASVTQFSYNTLGELTQITDPLSHTTALTYTTAGLIASITDAQNNTTSYQYDARGNRTAVIDPINGSAHPTTFAYDIMNRLTGITYPDGSAVSFGYDTRGRRTSETDQNNKTTTYAYDDADRLTSVTDPANNVTTYNYDTENNLTSITDANNHTTYFAYNARGWVTQTTFPSTLAESYVYDAVGNLTSKTDRKNQTIQYVYDALGRLTQKSYPDSTSANYVYDLVGKIRQVTDPTGVYGFAYDNMGRLIGTTTQYSFVTGTYSNSYTYDAASNRTSLTAPDGSITTYGYDTLNRLNGLANSWAGTFGFGYDALSRRTSLTRPNGVNTSYSYDSVSHLLSVLHQTGGTTIDGAGYTYDSAGNRTSKTNYLTGTTENYGYDPLYELTQVTQGGSTTESYSYDAVGNRLSSLGVPLYNYNSSNELMSSSAGSYTYDNNGNTLTDAQGRSFTWDFENRSVQATNPGVGTTTFKYDPFGRRIQKSGPSGSTDYLYDGVTLIQELSTSGGTLASYVQGSRIDAPLAELRGGVPSYYQQDALGSVTSVSQAAGSVVNSYGYSAFGSSTATTGTAVNSLRYTAREFDQDSGLYYYRARYYDSGLGRFLSEDSPWISRRSNLYTYVFNNPTRLRDFSGHQEVGPDEDLAEDAMEERELEREALVPIEPEMVPPPLTGSTMDYQPEPSDSNTGCGCPPVSTGDRVFRLFGGGAGPWGRSWSRDWFASIDDARNALGLPESPMNAGEFVLEGQVVDPEGATVHPANALGRRPGGGDEVEFTCPKLQVRITGLYPIPRK